MIYIVKLSNLFFKGSSFFFIHGQSFRNSARKAKKVILFLRSGTKCIYLYSSSHIEMGYNKWRTLLWHEWWKMLSSKAPSNLKWISCNLYLTAQVERLLRSTVSAAKLIRLIGHQLIPKMTTIEMSILLTLAFLAASSCLCRAVLEPGLPWALCFNLAIIWLVTTPLVIET